MGECILIDWLEPYLVIDLFKLYLNQLLSLMLVPLHTHIKRVLREYVVHQVGEFILITVNMATCLLSASSQFHSR